MIPTADLVKKWHEANEAYRKGAPIMSDKEFDQLTESLGDSAPVAIGHSVESDERKTKLPYRMASMNKCKSIDELRTWLKSKGMPANTEVVLSPKYDGISLLVEHSQCKAYTRGDGEYGQISDDHYAHLAKPSDSKGLASGLSYGEAIMDRNIFMEKWSHQFANARNLVAGMFNSKSPNIEILADIQYVPYGLVDTDGSKKKHEVFLALGCPYRICKLDETDETLFDELYGEWSKNFELDGLIVELDDLETQAYLGRESNGNPSFARAFKSDRYVQSAVTKVTGITWNISKNGLYKPIVHVEPVVLDGVTVSNVTGNNARWVKNMGIGTGAQVKIKRSGMVIPCIEETLVRVEFVAPDNSKWNENEVELVTVEKTEDQTIMEIVSFFEIIGADGVAEGLVRQLWAFGYKNLFDYLNARVEDLVNCPGFGKKKAEAFCTSVRTALTECTYAKLMHASGCFGTSLGSKKLALLEHFLEKPTVEEVTKIDGFAETTANAFVNGWDDFETFKKNLNFVPTRTKNEPVHGHLSGKTFVFTGVRLPDMEKLIAEHGGTIGSSVSKNTTYLVCKERGSGSSKETKAESLGVAILTPDELKSLLSEYSTFES